MPAPTIEKLHCVTLPGDTEITAVSYNVKSLARTSAGADRRRAELLEAPTSYSSRR